MTSQLTVGVPTSGPENQPFNSNISITIVPGVFMGSLPDPANGDRHPWPPYEWKPDEPGEPWRLQPLPRTESPETPSLVPKSWTPCPEGTTHTGPECSSLKANMVLIQ